MVYYTYRKGNKTKRMVKGYQMKGYVYMIDYKENKDDFWGDQIECADKKDLLTQVKLIANGTMNIYVEEIKLVNDKDRYIEKEISKSLYNECKKILKNKIK